MCDRSALIAKAASLPAGSEERRRILAQIKAAAEGYHNNPTFTLNMILHAAANDFAQDVARAIVKAAEKTLPLSRVKENFWNRGNTAYGQVFDPATRDGLVAAVQVSGLKTVNVTLSDMDGGLEKKWRLSAGESPKSLAHTIVPTWHALWLKQNP